VTQVAAMAVPAMRHQTGSPMTYLQRYRVARAKRLLEVTGQDIIDVALAVGFSSSKPSLTKSSAISFTLTRRSFGNPLGRSSKAV